MWLETNLELGSTILWEGPSNGGVQSLEVDSNNDPILPRVLLRKNMGHHVFLGEIPMTWRVINFCKSTWNLKHFFETFQYMASSIRLFHGLFTREAESNLRDLLKQDLD